jgi:hypothetical protein
LNCASEKGKTKKGKKEGMNEKKEKTDSNFHNILVGVYISS